jgi:hypothetical protein
MDNQQPEHLSRTEYRDEIKDWGRHLSLEAAKRVNGGLYDEYEAAVLNTAHSMLSTHSWLNPTVLDPADYGAILGYGSADVETYGDRPDPTGADTLEEQLRRMAAAQFEADCIENALERRD